jgi:hypothetical protein
MYSVVLRWTISMLPASSVVEYGKCRGREMSCLSSGGDDPLAGKGTACLPRVLSV